MEPFVEFFKQYLLPGSDSLLLFGLMIGVLLLLLPKPAPKWGKRWLVVLAGVYLLLSLPLFSTTFESALSYGTSQVKSTEQASGAEVIVILGGGSSTFLGSEGKLNILSEPSSLRVLEGVRLYSLLNEPQIIVSGGAAPRYDVLTPESEPLMDALIVSDIPAEKIIVEPASQDTHEQAVNIRELFEEIGVEHFVLVTSPTHMRRALGAFRAEGMDPIGSVAAQHSESTDNPFPLFPNLNALSNSKLGMREVLATLYYAARGWLSGPEHER